MNKSTLIFAGLALVATAATLVGQGASEPVKSAAEYFVTSEGDAAHLWIREGVTLRVVGHGVCKECALSQKPAEHKEGDGHDHGKK